MVVMFGDHQPSVEDEFYYEISGLSEDTVTSEESLIWYETPYLIWTNYGLEKQDLGDMSAFYLSSEMLQMAGLETTPYQKFLLGLREVLPVIHGRGCLDGDGNYYSLTGAESDGAFEQWLVNYDCLVYNHSVVTKFAGSGKRGMKMASDQNDFSKGSIVRNIINLAVPMTLAQLINVLYNVVDRIYIGRIPGAGSLPLTGVGLCLPIISMLRPSPTCLEWAGLPSVPLRGAGETWTRRRRSWETPLP